MPYEWSLTHGATVAKREWRVENLQTREEIQDGR